MVHTCVWKEQNTRLTAHKTDSITPYRQDYPLSIFGVSPRGTLRPPFSGNGQQQLSLVCLASRILSRENLKPRIDQSQDAITAQEPHKEVQEQRRNNAGADNSQEQSQALSQNRARIEPEQSQKFRTSTGWMSVWLEDSFCLSWMRNC